MGDALQAGTRKQKQARVSAAQLYFGNATKRTASVHFWTEVSENTQWPQQVTNTLEADHNLWPKV